MSLCGQLGHRDGERSSARRHPTATLRPHRGPDRGRGAEANRLPVGLAAYVFSGSAQRASDLVAAIEAGTVGVNTGVIVHRDSPLGGIKDSGWGSDGGLEGLAEFQVVKAVSRRS